MHTTHIRQVVTNLWQLCVAVHLMSESLSLLPDPHRMQSYFKGERYSRFPCLILAEQNESGKLEDCALYLKRDIVSFFRAHLQHGSDSHKDLRSESVKRKINMLSRYSDEDTSVALVFADGLNFVETPFFTYANEARSPNYPSNMGHPDTEYSVYTHTFKSTLGEFKVGTVESVTLAIFLDIFSALRNQTNKNSKSDFGLRLVCDSKMGGEIQRSRSSFDFTTHETLLEKHKSETKSLNHHSCQ